MNDLIQTSFTDHAALSTKTHALLGDKIRSSIELITKSLSHEGTLYWAGNGGSAADAQHMAAELVGRFKKERKPIRSIALTTNTSILTAIGNDYSYDLIFCRQLEAFAKAGDVLIAISTSGNSRNILEVAKLAHTLGVKVIGLTGETGGALAPLVDLLLNVPTKDTARVQEMHLLIEHILCEAIETSVV